MTTKLDYNTCANCGRKFTPTLGAHQKFCCANCRVVFHNRQWRERRRTTTRPNRTCERCGKRFYSSQSAARFCSRECYQAHERECRSARRAATAIAQMRREEKRRKQERDVYLARRDLEAKESERAVPVRVSYTSRGMRIVSRGNCAGGCTTSMRHTP